MAAKDADIWSPAIANAMLRSMGWVQSSADQYCQRAVRDLRQLRPVRQNG